MALIRKISDNAFGGNHPNGINVGYEKKSVAPTISLPQVGECYHFSGLRTSVVKKVYNVSTLGFTFDTSNSTYRVIYG